MKFISIKFDGIEFKKSIEGNVAYAFNEFDEEIYRFTSYARDFEEFEDDISFLITMKLINYLEE